MLTDELPTPRPHGLRGIRPRPRPDAPEPRDGDTGQAPAARAVHGLRAVRARPAHAERRRADRQERPLPTDLLAGPPPPGQPRPDTGQAPRRAS
ncbi:hypothetical protein [Nonomuraea pusilla]|uniref:Uncharacterized protein n=1 Tax=Nonomuraea pusilla TaxID=46177 RepID=A0A1H7M5J3_9ACTN|nr:hypothetical protein [Nonomuraea pusilla]SEL05995.1 hypothetical protein SAMN05660976_01757 [Nonomuraea pusilla]